jgi:hypothetical protein
MSVAGRMLFVEALAGQRPEIGQSDMGPSSSPAAARSKDE